MLDVWMLFSLFLPFSQVLIIVLVTHLKKERQPNHSFVKTEIPISTDLKGVQTCLRIGQTIIPVLALVFSLGFFAAGMLVYNMG